MQNVRLVLESIYSYNTVPLYLMSGTAQLVLPSNLLDFKIVERGQKTSANFQLKNTGTLPLAYRVKPMKAHAQLPFALWVLFLVLFV